ncbi:hypothetical protein RchiOBHm_Chr6g0282161 [Rosa chinensis]|uniref:Uncharacterized protein n=1 Tax=Rosa chinensis TaxID=74649 RepID=A0A2P6PTR0_ROSCH|nr:hypothetical protein RchiOBHm_Chr6g0282161 [Rosa chinensis]
MKKNKPIITTNAAKVAPPTPAATMTTLLDFFAAASQLPKGPPQSPGLPA